MVFDRLASGTWSFGFGSGLGGYGRYGADVTGGAGRGLSHDARACGRKAQGAVRPGAAVALWSEPRRCGGAWTQPALYKIFRLAVGRALRAAV